MLLVEVPWGNSRGFDHCLLWLELAAIGCWWWFDYLRETKDSVAHKREDKLKRHFGLHASLSFQFSALIVAPFIQFHAADEARKTAKQDLANLQASKPTPIKDKCLNIAKLLYDAADAWDKENAQYGSKMTPAGVESVNLNFWQGTAEELGGRIINVESVLLDHGFGESGNSYIAAG